MFNTCVKKQSLREHRDMNGDGKDGGLYGGGLLGSHQVPRHQSHGDEDPATSLRKRPFSEKVAMVKENQHDGENRGIQWRPIIRPYLISRAPESCCLLDCVEENQDVLACSDNISKRLNLSRNAISRSFTELWECLPMNLQGAVRTSHMDQQSKATRRIRCMDKDR